MNEAYRVATRHALAMRSRVNVEALRRVCRVFGLTASDAELLSVFPGAVYLRGES